MGIRPRFHVIVGIDDAKTDDPRRFQVDEELLEELMERPMTKEEMWRDDDLFDDWRDAEHHPGMTRYLYDKIYNPSLTSEFNIPNVIGYKLKSGPHDDDIVRALAAIDEKYLTPGYERIPTLDPEKHSLRYRRYGYTQEDIDRNMFVPGVFESMPQMSRMYWEQAKHYLRIVGWDIPEKDLRYILVWNWS